MVLLMKKFLWIIVLNLFLSVNTYAEKTLKDVGLGQKKLDINFLCTNDLDKTDKIKYSYKKYKLSSDNKTLLRLDYDDEDKNFFTPIRPIIKYKNLEYENIKNDVFVDYVILGKNGGEFFFQRSVFVDLKSKEFPYKLVTHYYTLTESEFNSFKDLDDYMWVENDNFFSNKKVRKETMIKFIKRNNEFHKTIKQSFKETVNSGLMEVVEPASDFTRITRQDDLMRMSGQPSYYIYTCVKK